LADNMVALYRDRPTVDYNHKNLGVVASLGLYKGVAELFGFIKLRGFLAWLAHRGYHVMAMPTGNRKIRIVIGWMGQFLMGREMVSLGSLHDPRQEFRNASVPPKPANDKPEAKPEQKAEPSISDVEGAKQA